MPRSPSPSSSSSAPEPGAGPPLLLLLVEDAPPDALAVEAVLAPEVRAGRMEVTRVASLAAAEAAVEPPRPDVILLDLNLPDSRGLASVRRLRERAGDVPIVALTGSEDRAVEHELVQAGGDDFVPKAGLERHLLLRVVRYAVDRRRRERETGLLRERLAEAHRLESLGHLAGGVAHRFNNILTSVVGAAALLRERRGEDDAELRADVDLILEEARQAQELTRRLLAFGHRQALAPRRVDVGRTLRELAPLLAPILGGPGDLRVEAADDLHVFLDPGMVEQVVVTLALHAREIIPRGEAVHLQAARLRGASGEPRARLRVGNPEATLPSPESPAESATHETPGLATVLGLETVHRLAEEAGGRLAVERGGGSGFVFVLDLPLAEGETSTEASEASEVRTGAEPRAGAREAPTVPRILLVEDEEVVRRVGERILRRLGMEVTSVEHGEAALEVLDAMEAGDAGPDLVVTDVMMPVLSGPDLVRRMRERGSTVPVLFVSGYSASELEGHELGPREAFLAKPFTPDELGASVAELLERSRDPADAG